MATKETSQKTSTTGSPIKPEDLTPARIAILINLSRSLMLTVLVLVVVAVAQGVGNIILVSVLKQQKSSYFAVQPDGSLTTIQPLTSPFDDPVVPQQFAVTTILDTFNFDYSDGKTGHGQVLESQRNNYSASAFKQISDQLTVQGGLVDLVDSNKAIAKMTLTTNPIMNPQYTGTNGSSPYQWEFKFTATLSVDSPNGAANQSRVIEVVVQRVPVSVNPKQMQITWVNQTTING